MQTNVHYHDYLQIDKILNAQFPESEKYNLPAHDEMLFIIIHQAYELWFKQLHHEVDSIAAIMSKPSLNDNSPELQTVVHRLNRCVTILRVLVHQIDIMETMTPMDFLDFRDMLRPASGFQSWQFKELEAKLGLKFEQRHGKEYYTAQLRSEHVEIIKKAENSQSLLQLLNTWLLRMPLLHHEAGETFWQSYKKIYDESLAAAEKSNLQAFDEIFNIKTITEERQLSPMACRAALFIMLYRGYPLMQLPFQLLNALLEIDEQLAAWRHRHMNMVHRMIGARIGTGGSSGKDYLKAAADKHYIYKEIAQLNSFLVERRKLPVLSKEAAISLGFV
ncbi:MAG TPA: tryptophan 2,3-dioxygenase family protein [Chitinophagaceae bacterium]|nr:tryptophan 2,3-dioxygenase family protein [Chitinophagaceae bacterium]HMX77552.1 tryptophan 2,3-dioxygenase family protein [Chitinophagaceae bacterium]HNA18519.1 tryptophan 2,3-dioxygenase family protein [Chitinophagaceae bacterium]HNA90942.1 tryptophan 2,3-dioxygenase family protein [Chitinophagaceae bacterium]HNA96081.1 tryptophan 2,3-dioxygenase family protein [Chitinophagaceae bacterium]